MFFKMWKKQLDYYGWKWWFYYFIFCIFISIILVTLKNF